MRRLLATSSVALALFVSGAVPAFAAANLPLLDPNFSIVPQECQTCACDYGGVLQLIQNLMNAGIAVGAIAFILIAAYAGATFMFNPTNPEARNHASSMLINVVVGLVIVLAAWLVVDFIMKALYSGEHGSAEFGPWNKVLLPEESGSWCIQPRNQGTIGGLAGNIATGFVGGNGTGPGSVSGDTGGGTCTQPSNQNNACSTANLSKTCFANRVTDASSVCMKESAGGQVAIESGSDRLNGGSGPSYSIGLWQINLTTTQLHTGSGTLNCPSAFTCPIAGKGCGGGNLVGSSKIGACNCTVSDQRLYQQCVAAAQNASVNTNAACGLYSQGGSNGGFQPWLTSAGRCNVPVH